MPHHRERAPISIRQVLETKAQILEGLEPLILIVSFMDHQVDSVQFIQDQGQLVLAKDRKLPVVHWLSVNRIENRKNKQFLRK